MAVCSIFCGCQLIVLADQSEQLTETGCQKTEAFDALVFFHGLAPTFARRAEGLKGQKSDPHRFRSKDPHSRELDALMRLRAFAGACDAWLLRWCLASMAR